MEKKPQNIPLHYLWSKGSTVKFIHLVAKKKKNLTASMEFYQRGRTRECDLSIFSSCGYLFFCSSTDLCPAVIPLDLHNNSSPLLKWQSQWYGCYGKWCDHWVICSIKRVAALSSSSKMMNLHSNSMSIIPLEEFHKILFRFSDDVFQESKRSH